MPAVPQTQHVTDNVSGLTTLFSEPSAAYDEKSMMGSQVSFGPGGEIQRVSLPNDFTAIRIWGYIAESSSTMLWGLLDVLCGYEVGERNHCHRRGAFDGKPFVEMAVEDPEFADLVCRGVRRSRGSLLGEVLERAPSSFRWGNEPHVGVTDARCVRLTWCAPRNPKNALLKFNGHRTPKLEEVTEAVRVFGSRASAAAYSMQNARFVVKVTGLPYDITSDRIRSRMPLKCKPSTAIVLPSAGYSDKRRNADLEDILNQMGTVGPCTVELRPKADVEYGKTGATAFFDFEKDAREAVRKYNDTADPFHRGGKLKVQPLYRVEFKVPCGWMFDPANTTRRIAEETLGIDFKTNGGSASSPATDYVTAHVEGINDASVTSFRKAFETWFAQCHRIAEEEEFRQLQERRESQDGEAAVSGESECPVCEGEPSDPIRSACGHVYCKECYVHMAQSEAGSGTECSLKCIGDGGSCGAPFPLDELKCVFQPAGYRKLLGSIMKAHVRKSPNELRCCPTPDCEQLYRPTPMDAHFEKLAQCPDCCVVMCSACHEPHDESVPCKAILDAETAELMAALDIKGCPRCNTFIERTEGCNHMECASCHAHICWLCMAVYSDSHSCYVHMSEEHGGAFAGIPGYDVWGERIDEPDAMLYEVDPQNEEHGEGEENGEEQEEDEEANQGGRGQVLMYRV
ncbi:hypothetical protein LX36DRAFT_689801 [Colletotrichum falcatum]|nr:hypothetical protein LX36DRAFT_689801 [Colletotrichum falcatum]